MATREIGAERPSERVWRILAGISTLVAAGVLWRVVQLQFTKPPRRAIPPPAAAEEQLDSAAMAEVSAAIGSQRNAHVLVALLDPQSPRVGGVARELEGRAKKLTPSVRLATLFIPLGNPPSISAMELALAVECARRQGREFELLEAARGREPTEPIRLGERAHLGDVTRYAGCILRRESMDAVTDALGLIRRLRIDTLPAFIVNSTVIRRPIDADSLLARARAASVPKPDLAKIR